MTRRLPLDVAQSDLIEVERIVRVAGTSFHRGMAILEPDRRAAMYGIYAFCRLVDDVVDGPDPEPQKRAALDGWRATVADLYRDAAETPVARVLRAARHRYALREADFRAVIDGMAMDAGAPIVAPDLAIFDLYCDRVAAAVGRLSVRAFGDASADADAVAHALGRALQHTNVLRDVAEDAALGRLYLPAEYLSAAGVPPDPELVVDHPGLPQACAMLAADAHRYFSEAEAAMRRCDRRAMRPARLMGATYAAVLAALERRGWECVSVPVRLPKLLKLWVALRHGLL